MRRIALVLVAVVTFVVAALGCGGHHHGGSHGPQLSALVPSGGPVGTAVMVLGSGFGTTQGTSTVTVGGAPAAVTSWASGAIGLTVPAASLGGSQPVIVRVGGTSSNSLAFDVQLPARLYVDDCNDAAPSRIYGYAINSGGAPVPLAGSPWIAPFSSTHFNGDGSEMALDPVFRKIYAAGTAALGTWSVDATTGELTADGAALAAGAGNIGVTVSPDGLRVYVAAAATNEILGFSAGATAHTPLPDSPYLSDSFHAADVPVLARDGAFLFLDNESNTHTFEGFRVQADGSLLPLPGSPFAAFATSANSFTLHTDGRNLYFADYSHGQVGGFAVDASTGAPSPLAGSPYAAVPIAGTLVPSRDGHHAYSTSYGGTLLARWDLDAAGALLPATLTTSAVPSTGAESTMLTTADGARLYVLDAGNLTILGFAVGSSGALTALPGSPFATGIPAGPRPCTLVITP
ncbi:MAG TPA: IPT/TIG domain-containing protein [bacterium]|nr:IPT/TIG domain-containing protein [bacterium]